LKCAECQQIDDQLHALDPSNEGVRQRTLHLTNQRES
jgi:hypothetical protein